MYMMKKVVFYLVGEGRIYDNWEG